MKGSFKMNTIIKKISAIAMAFTLIGTGTAITKTISPKSNNTLVSYAATVGRNTPHIHGQFVYHRYKTKNFKYNDFFDSMGEYHSYYTWDEVDTSYCRACDGVVSSKTTHYMSVIN